MPGIISYGVSWRTGWLSVSIVCLGDTLSLMCNFSPSMAACTIGQADLHLTYALHVAGSVSSQQTAEQWPPVPTAFFLKHRGQVRV